MFSWHETTLRGLCRLAFGLLVAVPTCAVLLAVVWCRCPLSVEYYRRAICRAIGARRSVGAGQFSAAQRHAVHRDCRWPIPRPPARWPNSERWSGEPAAKNPRSLARRPNCWIAAGSICSPNWSPGGCGVFAGSQAVVEIQAQQLTLHLADGTAPQTLTEVRGQLQGRAERAAGARRASEPQGTVEFQSGGSGRGGSGDGSPSTALRSRAAARRHR